MSHEVDLHKKGQFILLLVIFDTRLDCNSEDK